MTRSSPSRRRTISARWDQGQASEAYSMYRAPAGKPVDPSSAGRPEKLPWCRTLCCPMRGGHEAGRERGEAPCILDPFPEPRRPTFDFLLDVPLHASAPMRSSGTLCGCSKWSAHRRRTGSIAGVSSLANGLTHLSGWVAYLVIAALVFGETAVFIGFVLPGEIAVVLGGVLASRGHLSLPLLIVIVIAAAITGPMVDMRSVGGWGTGSSPREGCAGCSPASKGQADLAGTGGTAVLAGRFVAVVRALMPATAGAAGSGTARSLFTTGSGASSGVPATACSATWPGRPTPWSLAGSERAWP